MAIPRNQSLSSQIGQLLEEYAGILGHLPTAADLFPADLFDSFCSTHCARSDVPVKLPESPATPDQYHDYFGIRKV